jgi:stalled ribosome rescue protein Dom34
MTYPHAAVWMDHQRAHIVLFNAEDSRNVEIKSHAERHVHHKRGSVGSGHAPEDLHFFREIAEAVAGADEILVAGPAQAKQDFVKHAAAHIPQVHGRIVGVIDADHPSDGQLLSQARKWFTAADRLRPGGGMRLP